MAQNITLLGASYSDVPAVDLPKTGGGTARFADASVTTAVAEDVASGKVFLLADGSVGTGSASGGGGSSPMELLYTVTLTEDVHTITINVESSWKDYDVIAVMANGSLTSSDWMYWNINSTAYASSQWSAKSEDVYNAYTILTVPLQKLSEGGADDPNYRFMSRNSQDRFEVRTNSSYIFADLSYFWFGAYTNGKNFKAGTRFNVWGYKYEDL